VDALAIRSVLLPAALAFALLATLTPTATAAAPPGIPCQDGIAGPDCSVRALDCGVGFGYRPASQYAYAGAGCGRPTWYPCELASVDTDGNVRSCLIA
jgi:hypothetical protein